MTIIQSVDELPAAIEAASQSENFKLRWAIARLAKAFKRADLIPDDWEVGTGTDAVTRLSDSVPDEPPATRIDSERALYEHAAADMLRDETDAMTAAGKVVKKVRTPAGVKRYGAPIGTPIVRDAVTGKLRAVHSGEKVTTSGKAEPKEKGKETGPVRLPGKGGAPAKGTPPKGAKGKVDRGAPAQAAPPVKAKAQGTQAPGEPIRITPPVKPESKAAPNAPAAQQRRGGWKPPPGTTARPHPVSDLGEGDEILHRDGRPLVITGSRRDPRTGNISLFTEDEDGRAIAYSVPANSRIQLVQDESDEDAEAKRRAAENPEAEEAKKSELKAPAQIKRKESVSRRQGQEEPQLDLFADTEEGQIEAQKLRPTVPSRRTRGRRQQQEEGQLDLFADIEENAPEAAPEEPPKRETPQTPTDRAQQQVDEAKTKVKEIEDETWKGHPDAEIAKAKVDQAKSDLKEAKKVQAEQEAEAEAEAVEAEMPKPAEPQPRPQAREPIDENPETKPIHEVNQLYSDIANMMRNGAELPDKVSQIGQMKQRLKDIHRSHTGDDIESQDIRNTVEKALKTADDAIEKAHKQTEFVERIARDKRAREQDVEMKSRVTEAAKPLDRIGREELTTDQQREIANGVITQLTTMRAEAERVDRDFGTVNMRGSEVLQRDTALTNLDRQISLARIKIQQADDIDHAAERRRKVDAARADVEQKTQVAQDAKAVFREANAAWETAEDKSDPSSNEVRTAAALEMFDTDDERIRAEQALVKASRGLEPPRLQNQLEENRKMREQLLDYARREGIQVPERYRDTPPPDTGENRDAVPEPVEAEMPESETPETPEPARRTSEEVTSEARRGMTPRVYEVLSKGNKRRIDELEARIGTDDEQSDDKASLALTKKAQANLDKEWADIQGGESKAAEVATSETPTPGVQLTEEKSERERLRGEKAARDEASARRVAERAAEAVPSETNPKSLPDNLTEAQRTRLVTDGYVSVPNGTRKVDVYVDKGEGEFEKYQIEGKRVGGQTEWQVTFPGENEPSQFVEDRAEAMDLVSMDITREREPARAQAPEVEPETPKTLAEQLTGKKDSTGAAIDAESVYKIGRGKQRWKIAKVNNNGTVDLEPAGEGQRTRKNIPTTELDPAVAEAGTGGRETAVDATPGVLQERDLQDSIGDSLDSGKQYQIGDRSYQKWEVVSVNDNGTVNLEPVGESRGARARKRWEVDPKSLVPEGQVAKQREVRERIREETGATGMTAAEAAELDADAVDALIEGISTDGNFDHPDLPALVNRMREHHDIDASKRAEDRSLDDDTLDMLMQAASEDKNWTEFSHLYAEKERRIERQRKASRTMIRKEVAVGEMGPAAYIEAQVALGRRRDAVTRELAMNTLRDRYIISGNRFEDAVSQAYIQELEHVTRKAEDDLGYLTSRWVSEGVSVEDLWMQNEKTAARNASPELINWWEEHGRLTRAYFRQQILDEAQGRSVSKPPGLSTGLQGEAEARIKRQVEGKDRIVRKSKGKHISRAELIRRQERINQVLEEQKAHKAEVEADDIRPAGETDIEEPTPQAALGEIDRAIENPELTETPTPERGALTQEDQDAAMMKYLDESEDLEALDSQAAGELIDWYETYQSENGVPPEPDYITEVAERIRNNWIQKLSEGE